MKKNSSVCPTRKITLKADTQRCQNTFFEEHLSVATSVTRKLILIFPRNVFDFHGQRFHMLRLGQPQNTSQK